ncbi:MAG: SDR family oxidoreductase [Mesorhizobium sp.]|nr:MAG: SDR family oxidoreductase [Mesorhizobium sp.]
MYKRMGMLGASMAIAGGVPAQAAESKPTIVLVHGVIEIAGPKPVRMSDLVARFLKPTNDPRKVLADPNARYFGTELGDRSLGPGVTTRIGAIRFVDWFGHASIQHY